MALWGEYFLIANERGAERGSCRWVSIKRDRMYVCTCRVSFLSRGGAGSFFLIREGIREESFFSRRRRRSFLSARDSSTIGQCGVSRLPM